MNWYTLNRASGLTLEDTTGDGCGRYTPADKAKILQAIGDRADRLEGGYPEDAMTHKPRVYMHPDGLFVSVGFDDTQDTILKVGGHDGPGGHGDVAHAREWVAAVREALGMESQDGA